MKTALLIIDVQRALCEGEYAAHDASAMIERINALSSKARDAGVPVVAIQHEEAGGPLAHATDGWQLARTLRIESSDVKVRKTACDAFHQTDLAQTLRARGIEKLIVCGLQTEYCVDTTVRRALSLGFPVTLVSDAHSTLDNGTLTAAQIIAHHNETLKNINNFEVAMQVLCASEIVFAS